MSRLKPNQPNNCQINKKSDNFFFGQTDRPTDRQTLWFIGKLSVKCFVNISRNKTIHPFKFTQSTQQLSNSF